MVLPCTSKFALHTDVILPFSRSSWMDSYFHSLFNFCWSRYWFRKERWPTPVLLLPLLPLMLFERDPELDSSTTFGAELASRGVGEGGGEGIVRCCSRQILYASSTYGVKRVLAQALTTSNPCSVYNPPTYASKVSAIVTVNEPFICRDRCTTLDIRRRPQCQ